MSEIIPHLAASLATRVIDTSAWIGNYPFRGIPNSSIADVKRLQKELNIEKSIVAPFEGIFWENTLDAHKHFAEQIAGESTLELWPVVRPGAAVGIEKLLDRYKPRGIRLLPNYHGYRLSDPDAGRILDLARERKLIVQVFARIADERWHHLLHVPGVDQHDLDYLTSVYADQPILISGAASLGPLSARLKELPMLFADHSRIRGPQFAIESLAKSLPMGKIVFGSLWPIQIIEATLWQVTTAKIDDAMKSAVLYDNAQKLLSYASA